MKKLLWGALIAVLVILGCYNPTGLLDPPEPSIEQGVPNLGISVRAVSGGYRVVEVYPYSPALLAGIEEGDLITAIDYMPTGANLPVWPVDSVGGTAGRTRQFMIARNEAYFSATALLEPYRIPDLEYEFCQLFLDAFFIYRQDLPRYPYSYYSPLELYESVNDPYTVYFDKQEGKSFLTYLTTEMAGMGISIDSTEFGYRISDVVPGSPALRAGLRVGDFIVSVNENSLAEHDVAAVIALLRGVKGDIRRLGIVRGESELTISVTLDSFLSRSVFLDSLDENTALISLTSFSSTTALSGGTIVEFRAALTAAANFESLILDLRDNYGGELDQCIAVCSEFTQGAVPLMRVQERTYDELSDEFVTIDTSWTTTAGGGRAVGRNWQVLVNRNTASASEILLACIHEYRPEIVTIGENTYGKGRGQVFMDTPDTGLVKVTYATIDPLSGPSYDLVGITPMEPVATGIDALEVALDNIASGLGRRHPAARPQGSRRDCAGAVRPPLCVGSLPPFFVNPDR